MSGECIEDRLYLNAVEIYFLLTAEKLIFLSTAPPNFMTKLPSLVSLREGGNLSLEIAVSGSPFPKITWSVHGREIVNKSRLIITNNKFEIRGVRFEDQGLITCTAQNVFGVQETKTELVVFGEFLLNFSSSVRELPFKVVFIQDNFYAFPAYETHSVR